MTVLPDNSQYKDEQWIYISDMMAGLMIIFLFVSIQLLENINTKIGDYERSRSTICKELENLKSELESEFDTDAEQWEMEVCDDRVNIKFEEKSDVQINKSYVLFDSGKQSLTPKFREILNSFLPRLLRMMIKHKQSIDGLRIDGHADSRGYDNLDDKGDYIENTKLSQGRSISVLTHLLRKIDRPEYSRWEDFKITAHGLSSTAPKMKEGGEGENYNLSRRVEFKIVLKAENTLINSVIRKRTSEK